MNKQVISFYDSAVLASYHGNNTALIENENDKTRAVSYLELDELVTQAKKHIARYHATPFKKQLIMMVAHNSIESVVYYLAALQLKHVVWWIDKECPEARLKQLQAHYAVNLFIDRDKIESLNIHPLSLHDDLALLITTSGSTGSPTLVRLSKKNLNSNCQSICQALSLQSSDRVISTLPLQYSFGLSILNSHLCAGATIVLTEATLMSRDFWSLFKSNDIKCLYGVPHTFDMLLKLSLARLPLKSLRFMAVAGGKLSPDKVSLVNDYCLDNNAQFYVMYGQTEATARMTVLSPEKAKIKPQSIGKAIAGKLWIEDTEGQVISQPNISGELCYQGDNVMMGIAQSIDDLALSQQTPILRTGDLASVDSDGDYQIVGRLKRIIKVVGHRINLDEIEHYFANKKIHIACTGQDDMIFCYLLNTEDSNADLDAYRQQLSEYLSIHSSYCQWLAVTEFPYLSSGKLNYKQLDNIRRDKGNR